MHGGSEIKETCHQRWVDNQQSGCSALGGAAERAGVTPCECMSYRNWWNFPEESAEKIKKGTNWCHYYKYGPKEIELWEDLQ